MYRKILYRNILVFLVCLLLAISITWASQLDGTTTTKAPVSDDLKIAAFNVQVFGSAKMGKPEVVNSLVKIIRRYDVVLIQEIRDASGESIVKLLERVNQDRNHNYELVISDRLGRTRSKEQYAFFYRSGIGLEVSSTFQYPDLNDKFERPPYSILLKVPNQELRQVALVAIHVSPDTAEIEIDALVDVHKAVKDQWKTSNIVIMGDFNAASPYTTQTEMKKLRLRDSPYVWLIPDSLDTTLSQSVSAYDRFVITGTELKNSIVPDSATAFRFDEAYGLNEEQAKLVSDHYPIEFAIRINGVSAYTNGGTARTGFFSRITEFAQGLFSMDQQEL